MGESSIPIKFVLGSFQPDRRQYKTSSPILIPVGDLVIQVNVPLKSELVANASEIIMKQLSGEKYPDPVLTPKGLAYIENVLLDRIDEPEPQSFDVKYSDEDFEEL